MTVRRTGGFPLRRPLTFLSRYGRKAERERRGSQSNREFLTHHHKALRKTYLSKSNGAATRKPPAYLRFLYFTPSTATELSHLASTLVARRGHYKGQGKGTRDKGKGKRDKAKE